ncbi:MAG: 40S ribosomal protein S19, partial [archaeon]
MGIFDVPAGMLVEEAAKDLKTKIREPEFVAYVKTGAHRERAPQRRDWFYMRAASILYQTYKQGNVGTGGLRSYYGGRKNMKVRPEHKVKASGKIIRLCLQMLEKEGLLKKEKVGRKVSGKGEKFLMEKARAVEKVFKEQLRLKEEKSNEEMAKRNTAKKQRQEKQAQEKQVKTGNTAQAPQKAAQPTPPVARTGGETIAKDEAKKAGPQKAGAEKQQEQKPSETGQERQKDASPTGASQSHTSETSMGSRTQQPNSLSSPKGEDSTRTQQPKLLPEVK